MLSLTGVCRETSTPTPVTPRVTLYNKHFTWAPSALHLRGLPGRPTTTPMGKEAEIQSMKDRHPAPWRSQPIPPAGLTGPPTSVSPTASAGSIQAGRLTHIIFKAGFGAVLALGAGRGVTEALGG